MAWVVAVGVAVGEVAAWGLAVLPVADVSLVAVSGADVPINDAGADGLDWLLVICVCCVRCSSHLARALAMRLARSSVAVTITWGDAGVTIGI